MRRAGLVWGVLVVGLVAACGGSTPPPAAPEEEASAGSAAPEDAPPKAEPKEESAAPEASAETSTEELGSILQRVIEDTELDQYLKLTLPGRFPLKIAGPNLPGGLSLTKGNQPVSVVEGPKDKKDPVLVLTEINVKGSKATVGYRYDVEGIRGTAHLKKGERGWELESSRIVEH